MASDLIVAVVKHLGELQEDAAHEERAEQLEVAKECLCDAFELDANAPGDTSRSLSEAWEASSEPQVSEKLSDAFAKFILDVSKKGFFEGCEAGSAEFNDRFSKAKTKFFSKYGNTKPAAPAGPTPD